MGSKKAVLFNQLNLGRDVNRNRGRRLCKRLTRGFSSRTETGQELVEFAIVLPLLLLVVIGVFDLGRVLHANITMANASRTGARYATSFGFEDSGGSVILDITEIENRTHQEAQDSGFTLDSVSVDCIGPCERGGSLEVTVTHNFQFLFNAFIGSGITLTHTTEMLIPW